jgi:hypothetical protein
LNTNLNLRGKNTEGKKKGDVWAINGLVHMAIKIAGILTSKLKKVMVHEIINKFYS